MTVETDDIRLSLLSDFGINATISGGVSILGIWDEEFFFVTSDGENVTATQPQFCVRTSDAATLRDGDTITINSVVWTINSLQPDGTGFTVLSVYK